MQNNTLENKTSERVTFYTLLDEYLEAAKAKTLNKTTLVEEQQKPTKVVTFYTLLDEYIEEAKLKKIVKAPMAEEQTKPVKVVTFYTLLDEYLEEAKLKKLPEKQEVVQAQSTQLQFADIAKGFEKVDEKVLEKLTAEPEVVPAPIEVPPTPALPQDPVANELPMETIAKKQFKLTPPENLDELFDKMCVKRGRKLIYAPKEVLYDASFTVLDTNKKNDEGIRIKDILEAEIKEGTRLGYLDKYDGLKTSEIKEEYENDIIYEYAEQEFKKMGIIYDGKQLKVYVYDWDGKACHHIGHIDETAAAESIKYFTDKENYSFDLCGIITGGKGKRVTKNEDGKITITKEKGGDYGVELDISVLKRKD